MTILIVIIGISVLILVHELGHFLVAKKMGLLVEEFGFGFPPRLFSKKIGETVYSFNALPFGGFVKIHGEDLSAEESSVAVAPERSFASQKIWRRTVIIAAGVLMNFLLGWLIMSAIFMIGTPKVLLVSEVLPDSPAEAVGLLPGDRVKGFENASDFIDSVNKNRGREIALDIERKGEALSFAVTPRADGEAALGVVLNEAGIDRKPVLVSLAAGLKASVGVVVAILVAFLNLIWGLLTQGQLLVDVVGPVGIFGVAAQAGELGFLYVLQLIALISLNLAVLNAFPFPALDGGRLLFLIIEKIKGSPLPAQLERGANMLGFALILLLMIAITVRDVAGLF